MLSPSLFMNKFILRLGGLIVGLLDVCCSFLENHNPFPKFFSDGEVTHLVMKLAMDCTSDLVTSGCVELTIIVLPQGEIVCIDKVVASENDFPKLNVAATKMGLHSRFPMRKVSSIILGSRPRTIDTRHEKSLFRIYVGNLGMSLF